MPWKQLFFPPKPSWSELCQDSKLRARLKLHYYQAKRGSHGADLGAYWNSDVWMLTVKDLTPAVRLLSQVCNKSTMLYWDVSAQLSEVNVCPSIIFACIYKCWFRYHDNDPDLEFGKFFAQPFRITQTGPHTIPDILKAHAHLYDQAALDLESTKRGADSYPDKRSYWENFHLLPLSRAIIVLLDEELSEPVLKEDGTVSLDDEVQRRTAVLVLTGFNQGLSGVLNFDNIRSNALPLARDDISATGDLNVIRVSLKTAVHFIAELQQREERAGLDPTGGFTATTPESAKDHGSTTAKEADEYAEDILANASTDPSKARALKSATEQVKLIDSGLMNPDIEFGYWNPKYV